MDVAKAEVGHSIKMKKLASTQQTSSRTLPPPSPPKQSVIVYPNKQKRGIFVPTMPLTTGPLCMPTHI